MTFYSIIIWLLGWVLLSSCEKRNIWSIDTTDLNPANADQLVVEQSNYDFPMQVVDVAIADFGFLERIQLNRSQLTQVLQILNDSSNFSWGSTSKFDEFVRLRFYNQSDELIGITQVDSSGFLFAEPHLAIMKSGKLKPLGKKRLLEILRFLKPS